MKEYDVIIVGASIAGCSAAILYGQHGLNVALIDRKTNSSSHYKSMCTHTIQASALSSIQKLGIISALKNHGGILTHHQIWSKYGWIKRDLTEINKYENYGLNITRKLLDPILRKEIHKYPSIEYLCGSHIDDLLTRNGKICGVKFFNKNYINGIKLFSKLVVGADGANSKIAKLSSIGATVNPNNRFGYFAYFKHQTLLSITDSKIWYLEPDIAYAFPNENGLMLLGYTAEKSRLKNIKDNLNEKFVQLFSDFPNSNIHKNVIQVSPFYATGKMKNIFRHEPLFGLAFIGDAALTLDPAAGVGIGYAFQSADLLVEFTRKSLIENKNYHEAAKNYYYHYSALMRDTYRIISHDSLAGSFGEIANFVFSNAPGNPFLSNLFLDFCAKKITVNQFFSTLELFRNKKEVDEKCALNNHEFIGTLKTNSSRSFTSA